MKQTLIFDEKGIKVYEEVYRGVRGTIYLITNEEEGFHVGEKPPLEYEYLKEEMNDYLEDKETQISADVEDEGGYNLVEDYRSEDMAAFWEPGTEGF